MSTVKIQYVKSVIGRTKKQKLTIEALGFKRLNQIVEKESNPQILGMLKKVEHLVKIID